MLVHVEIVHTYNKNFIIRQGYACNDKIDAGKAPRSVSLRAV